MKQARFTIIIPTYNRSAFIKGTIQSVLDQSFSNFEIIVVDDGSKDDTETVVQSINDERVAYYKKENGERGAARNYGIARAKGEYITFLDSDDQLYPHHFQEAERVVTSLGSPEMFRLAYEYKTPEGKVLSKKYHGKNINKQLVRGNIFSCIGVFVKREILQQINFSENRKLSGTEDWLLWLRLAARYRIYGSNTITAAMINHDMRSVLNYDEAEMLTRTRLLMESLRNDKVFVQNMGHYLNRIEAHMLSYIAIHLALSGKKNRAWYYLRKTLSKSVPEFFTRRTLAIIRHCVLG